jgi:hypothetical protein
MTAGQYLPAYDMTVRRSLDNAQTNIGFVGGLEDTATLAAFCSGTNVYLVTWKNQGSLGSAGDASQSTAANQPQVCAAGVVETQNGQPTLVFNGGQQSLTVPAAVSFGLASSWFYSQVAYWSSGVTAGVGTFQVNGVYYNENTWIAGAIFSSAGNNQQLYVSKSSVYGLRSISYNLSNQTAYVNFNGPANQNSVTITSANWVPLAGFYIGFPTENTLTGNSQEFVAAPSYRWTAQDNKAYDLNTASFYGITGVTQ